MANAGISVIRKNLITETNVKSFNSNRCKSQMMINVGVKEDGFEVRYTQIKIFNKPSTLAAHIITLMILHS